MIGNFNLAGLEDNRALNPIAAQFLLIPVHVGIRKNDCHEIIFRFLLLKKANSEYLFCRILNSEPLNSPDLSGLLL